MPYGYKIVRPGNPPQALIGPNTWCCWACGDWAEGDRTCAACRNWSRVRYPPQHWTSSGTGQPMALYATLADATYAAQSDRDIWSVFYEAANRPPHTSAACVSASTAFASRVMLCCLVRPGRPAQ